MNASKTLDDLRAVLLKEGYILSHAAFYLRLIPRRFDTVEGKRHVHTVPVENTKARNNLRNKHQNANFTFATKQYMTGIACLLGSENVFVLSVDDKAKVPIGVTATTKQSPLLATRS